MDTNISTQIKKLRFKTGLSQAQLACLLGVKPSAVSRLEQPDYCGHTVKTLGKIASVLKCELIIELRPTDRTPDIESEYAKISPFKRSISLRVTRNGKEYLQLNQEQEYKWLGKMNFEQLMGKKNKIILKILLDER